MDFRPRQLLIFLSILSGCTLGCGVVSANDNMLLNAAKCTDRDSCISIMLNATRPRNPEAINVAAARIGELSKPPRGNRKAARDSNSQGLMAFKKGNFSESVALFQRAAAEDPGDVEVRSNLGLALLKDNRLKEAKQALLDSLAINPRRTNAWVPMAEVLFEQNDPDNAVAALLLAHEFSENKEKTRTYFEGKTASTERASAAYQKALRLIREPHDTASNADDAPKSDNRQMLTRSGASAYLAKYLESDPEIRSDPIKKEFFVCFIENALNDLYSNTSTVDAAALEARLRTNLESMTKDDPKAKLQAMKCIVNSPALAKAVTEGSSEARRPSTTQQLDMDDLRLDIASLGGKTVRVRGLGFYMMDTFMLKKNLADMSPLMVDIAKLPRDQRRAILGNCSNVMSGCRVTVQGIVGKVAYQNGIQAERVDF